MNSTNMDTAARLFPARWCVLDGSMLKILAVVLMLIDHIAHLFRLGDGIVLLSVGASELTLYEAFRYAGRLAFPLFAFLLVEGFLHTRNRKRYALRLLIFALISEIPFNLFCSGNFLYTRQNVFFTLLFGFLGLCALEKLLGWRRVLCVIGLFGIAYFFRADYAQTGYVLILLLYALRSVPVVRALGITTVSGIPAGASALPIALYNGERGCIKGRAFGIAFYVFYPAHLLLLVLIKILL